MRNRVLCITLLSCVAWVAPTRAADKAPLLPNLSKQTPQAFQIQIDRVHAQMRQGGRFEYISHDAREEVDQKLGRMKAMIAMAGTVAHMSEDDKVTLFNTQQRVNELLTHYDSNRKICTRAQQPGTLFRITTCHTYAELHRRSRNAQRTLENMRTMPQAQPFASGGGG